MWQQECIWFFTIFHHEFRTNNPIAFEVLMVLAVAHLFGFYNPKQLADFLEVPHQNFYPGLFMKAKHAHGIHSITSYNRASHNLNHRSEST